MSLPSEGRVLLVGGESAFQGWVKLALRDSEFQIVGEAAGVEETARLAAELEADLLLIDAPGVTPVTEMRAHGVSVPAVLMTASPERGFNENAREAGAQGTILSKGSIAELLATLRAVSRGKASFDPRHPRRPSGQSSLSGREREVLRLVARGETNREIASELGISDQTVKTLVARSCAKLGVRRRGDAAAAARGLGLLLL